MRISKIEQIRALKNGNGIQYLLNKAVEVMGNPILMHDMEFRFQACTENVSIDDPIWNEFVTTSTVGQERLEFYVTENFMEAAANTKTVTLLTSEKLKYDRIFGKIYNGENTQVACVCMVACWKPLEEDDTAIFEAFCSVLSREVSHSEFYTSHGKLYQETLIGKLIDGSIEDRKLYTAYVETIYDNLGKYIYVAVSQIASDDSDNNQLAYYRDLFKKAKPEYKYYIYQNYIVTIMSTNNAELDTKRDLKQLNAIFRTNRIYTGVSSRFENLFKIRKYYLEALAALNDGLDQQTKWIHQYSETKAND